MAKRLKGDVVLTWAPFHHLNTSIEDPHIVPIETLKKFGGPRIRNKWSVASFGKGAWGQVLTMISAGILGHLGHLEWNTRHNWRWGTL